MRNLLIITQKVDIDDDLLGFFVGWLREFSKHFDKVFVITLAKGRYELPANVFIYSLGKETGSPKFKKLIKFYWYLFNLIPKTNGIFAHMSPIFAIASWPAAFLFRKKIILWYLHRSLTLRLKIAEKLCYKILTAAKESLTLKSKKIIEVGHGVDIDRFRTDRNWGDLNSKQLRILSVGRVSLIKDYETLIRAAGILKGKGLKFKIIIVGRPVMSYDFEYFEKLKKLVEELKLIDNVEFTDFIPYSHIADYYKKADIFINLAPTGGIDKVVLEAMASGCVILISNQAFRKYVQDHEILFFEHGNFEELAQKIVSMSEFSSDKIRGIRKRFFDSVSSHHNLVRLIDKISSLYG